MTTTRGSGVTGDELRTLPDGTQRHPALSGRGWCVSCDGITARRGAAGQWQHGWCEAGKVVGTYLGGLGARARGGV